MQRLIRSTTVWALAMVVAAIAIIGAQDAAPNGSGFASTALVGKWRSDLDSPHGRTTMTFELKLDPSDSKKVTGTLTNDMTGTVALSGQYVGGSLTFTLDTAMALSFAGKLKDKDTLVGSFSSQMGDLPCTATRVPEK